MSSFIIIVLEFMVCYEYVYMLCMHVCIHIFEYTCVCAGTHVHACAWMCKSKFDLRSVPSSLSSFTIETGFTAEPGVCQNGSCSCPTSSKGHTLLELDKGNHTHPTNI